MNAPEPIADLLRQLVGEARAAHPDRPALIGVGGAQGSGKTHQCRAFAARAPRVAHFSLDDVYFTRAERAAMSKRFHPLFATRGPPGTHSLGLAVTTIAALRAAEAGTGTKLPRFDKALDDRAPEALWPIYVGRPDAIIVDGWCMGALPDDGPVAPLNALEAEADADGRWRAQVRVDIADRYQLFFDGFDAIVYLQAPSFEIVRRWRGEQEEQMLGRAMTPEENAALDRFIMHYERVTRAMLAGNHRAGWIVHLDEARAAVRVERRG